MKKFYHILALMALIHLFALTGLVGYLFASGRLDEQRMEQIGIVLRGQFPTSQPATRPAESQPAAPEASQAEIGRLQAQKEFYALLAQRHQRELDDRRLLNERIQLDVVQKLEEIEKRKAQLDQQRKALKQQNEQEGLTQTMEMVSSMEPALAKNLLRHQMKEPDAIELIKRMDPGRVKKIFNTCKTQEETVWLGRILNQIQNQDSRAGGGVDGPKPSSPGG